jgi:hypothetical protein
MIYKKPPKFINYPVVTQHINDDTFLADIVNHYSGRLHYPDSMTVSHETTHMINADIRNAHGYGNNAGFYVGNNNAAIMLQPNFKKSIIGSYVPKELQGISFEQYVVGMTEWNDSPLYLYDEWCAYINGGKAAVDLVEKHLYKDGWTNAVSNPLEFSVYACAILLAINQTDSNYLYNEPNYLSYTYFSLTNSYDVYMRGSVMTEFKWDKQDKYLTDLRNNKSITNVLETYFNGVWLS